MEKDSKISFVSNEDIEERIQIVMRQTDYTKEVAREKLTKCDYDTIKCIKEYLGITEKKALPQVSVNQQIYRELRNKMGSVSLPHPQT